MNNSHGHIGNHLLFDHLSSSYLLYLQTVHIQCHYLHMGIKSLHQALLSHSLGLIGASFCYLENVGKYNVVCQYGENIRYSERYHNPLIHFEGAHGGCHGPHY